jgi:hypothetical protein
MPKQDFSSPQECAERIMQIRQRLEEYKNYCNNPYLYNVREFQDHAPEDIEFLLDLLAAQNP